VRLVAVGGVTQGVDATIRGRRVHLLAKGLGCAIGQLERSGIAGASLAMARGGRLVLARGYGLTDVAAGERVQPQTRFTLASVSKAIAVTVLKLVQEGRPSLDAAVLALLQVGDRRSTALADEQ
jgi:CubicO group peptidase (beta-lactamase class C family)